MLNTTSPTAWPGAPADYELPAYRWEKDAEGHFVRVATEEAVARGVFGAPFFFVDGEPCWGADRLPQIELRLAEGAA